MVEQCIDGIIVDDESYEIKAVRAHLSGAITVQDLQCSLELSRAQTYRLLKRYKEEGPSGVISRKAGVRNRAFPDAERQRIMTIVGEHYPDFGPKFAAEKLQMFHGIMISKESLRRWMIDDGLWTDRAGRQPKIYSPRKPRERRGELIQVDGSYHRWFEKRGPESCLLVFIDDATSEIMQMLMVDHESSYNYMTALKRYISRYGRPNALYADRHSVFRINNPGKGPRQSTQFARACSELGISVICASSPQAKGRVERANRTLQDRLIKEMRLRNISTIEEANGYLAIYAEQHNRRFAYPPLDPEDAHLPSHNVDLDALLTYTVQRKVFKDLSVSFNKIRYILENTELSRKAIGKRVSVVLRLSGQLDILFDETSLPYYHFDKIRRISTDVPVDRKRLGAALALAKCINEVEPHHFQRVHVAAGFRKHFQEPEDLKSIALRTAHPSIRREYRGKAACSTPHPSDRHLARPP